MVELRKIHRDNLEEILELRVSESRENLCVHTAQSLAQAWPWKTQPQSICIIPLAL